MKYKNIIFDFGNVIGKFDGRYILSQFCSSEADLEILYPAVYRDWAKIDAGAVDYDRNVDDVASRVPGRLQETVQRFFREWPEYVIPISQTEAFIKELKENHIPHYLLSNAPTYFAEWASRYEILKDFSGIVFSAPIKMAKPDPRIYRYLFDTHSLDPRECFFIDDLEKNVASGRSLGMDGIVFTGDIGAVKKAVGL